jgi:hypothetical protein
MGFFVTIDQRTENGVLALLCARAPRISSPVFHTSHLIGRHPIISQHPIEFRYSVASNRCGNDGPVFFMTDGGGTSALANLPPYNPHRQPSLLHPTL